jgi:hypothetical protein
MVSMACAARVADLNMMNMKDVTKSVDIQSGIYLLFIF